MKNNMLSSVAIAIAYFLSVNVMEFLHLFLLLGPDYKASVRTHSSV